MSWFSSSVEERIQNEGLDAGRGQAWPDQHLRSIYQGLLEIAQNPLPERVIQPQLTGDVEDAAAGMAVLNGLDWMQMTEPERQPYREVAADKLIQASKDAELARQAELEKEGAFDGLDGH